MLFGCRPVFGDSSNFTTAIGTCHTGVWHCHLGVVKGLSKSEAAFY
jgi:hypothetical protein